MFMYYISEEYTGIISRKGGGRFVYPEGRLVTLWDLNAPRTIDFRGGGSQKPPCIHLCKYLSIASLPLKIHTFSPRPPLHSYLQIILEYNHKLYPFTIKFHFTFLDLFSKPPSTLSLVPNRVSIKRREKMRNFFFCISQTLSSSFRIFARKWIMGNFTLIYFAKQKLKNFPIIFFIFLRTNAKMWNFRRKKYSSKM